MNIGPGEYSVLELRTKKLSKIAEAHGVSYELKQPSQIAHRTIVGKDNEFQVLNGDFVNQNLYRDPLDCFAKFCKWTFKMCVCVGYFCSKTCRFLDDVAML